MIMKNKTFKFKVLQFTHKCMAYADHYDLTIHYNEENYICTSLYLFVLIDIKMNENIERYIYIGRYRLYIINHSYTQTLILLRPFAI